VRQSPVANKNLDPDGLRPHLLGQLAIQGTAPAKGSNPGQCFIDGLLIEGSVTIAAGNLGAFSLSHSTIVSHPSVVRPVSLNAASLPGGASDNDALTVTLYRSICGPISLNAPVPTLNITDSISGAITALAAGISVQTSTILGIVTGRLLNASDSIFTASVTIERQQTGCVRFCYVSSGSQTPRRYRCQPDLALTGVTVKAAQDAIRARLTPQFTSVDFSQPGYAQLASTCATEIATGADNEGEMGAFNFLQQPQRRANLMAALDEYLRFGLEAGAVEQT
jgi:hypothetical protein